MRFSSTVLRVTAALIGIVAIALVASTIPEVLDQSSGGLDTGGGDGAGGEDLSDEDVSDQTPSGSFTYADLILQILVIGTALFLIVAFVALLVDEPRKFLLGMAKVILAVGIVTAILAAGLMMMDFDPSPEETEPEGEHPTGGEAGEPQGESGSDGTDISGPMLVLGIVLLGAVAGLGGLLWKRYSDEFAVDDDSASESTTDLVGSVAGETADRIEADDGLLLENEVYRAWRQMTSLLAVKNPESSTPGEFAAAAINAGFGREEVTELTSLFETVRYGDVEASATDERRAVEILRRVENVADEPTTASTGAGATTSRVDRSSTDTLDGHQLSQHGAEESE